jgi:3-methyladenine DNA glycosylase AlkD
MRYPEIMRELQSRANPANAAGMARFGINPQNTLGISVYELRRMAQRIGKDHALALELWGSGVHEARLLASFIEEPGSVTAEQLEEWAADFDSWDIVDQVSDLIYRTPFVLPKIHRWAAREEEFVKRAAFSLIAELATHDKKMNDIDFEQFFPIIEAAATDERNFVKKAVNWALRNIGKRNRALNARAIEVAGEIRDMDSRAARWIGADALRELTGAAVQARLDR